MKKKMENIKYQHELEKNSENHTQLSKYNSNYPCHLGVKTEDSVRRC